MRSLLGKRLFSAVLVLALVGISAPAHAASVLQIQFTGLNFVYNGNAIYDAQAQAGGVGNFAQADPLLTMSFLVDGINQGTLLNDIYTGFYIPGVSNIPIGGGTVFSTGGNIGRGAFGYFDLLTSSSVPGWGLALDLTNPVQIDYSGGQVFLSGGGVTSTIAAQNLPFNLAIGTPVKFSFSSNNISNVTDDGRFLSSFRSSGTGEVTGPVAAIPEPATLVLMGLGLLGGGALRRRRKLS